MRIRLETAGRPPFWLIGDPALNEREVTEAMQPVLQITRQQQSVTGAGQDITEHYDRGNQKVVLEATTYREFASEWDRMDYVARLAPTDRAALVHEWEGDAWLRLTRRDGGNDFREWLMPSVVVALAGSELKGEVGLQVRYRITCGGFGARRKEGTSQVTLLLGSDADNFGMILSVAGLNDLLSPTYGPHTTGFRLNWQRPGAEWNVLMRVSGASGEGQWNLPFATAAEDVAEYLADFLPSSLDDVTVEGDEFRVVDVAPWYEYIELRIYHQWNEPGYGAQEALILEQDAAILPGPEFRLIGTTASDDQLTGLIEE